MADDDPGNLDFYKDQIVKLFSDSHADDRPPPTSVAPDLSAERRVKAKTEDASPASALLFSGGLGQELSEANRDKLEVFLERSVDQLNEQFQKFFQTVLAVRRIRLHLDKKQSPEHFSGRDEDNDTVYGEKNLPPLVADAIQTVVGTLESEAYEELRRDFQEILESGGLQADLALRRYSSDLGVTLRNIAEQAEDYLDVLLSKCRDMTLTEKQQLRHQIQKLSGTSLDFVAEIVKHRKPTAEKNSEVHVELNQQDTSTLWRLHYFIKLIETINRLSVG